MLNFLYKLLKCLPESKSDNDWHLFMVNYDFLFFVATQTKFSGIKWYSKKCYPSDHECYQKKN